MLSDGSVRCWGANTYGKLGQGHLSDVLVADRFLSVTELGEDMIALRVVAGEDHACAILQDETLKCWGDGSDGQPEPQAHHGSRQWRGVEGSAIIFCRQNTSDFSFSQRILVCFLAVSTSRFLQGSQAVSLPTGKTKSRKNSNSEDGYKIYCPYTSLSHRRFDAQTSTKAAIDS